MSERFIALSVIGVVITIACGVSSYWKEYLTNAFNRRQLNEVTASTVIMVDDGDYPGHVLSMVEQASSIGASDTRDDDTDSIPEPIQITSTTSADPIIAQSCSAYR